MVASCSVMCVKRACVGSDRLIITNLILKYFRPEDAPSYLSTKCLWDLSREEIYGEYQMSDMMNFLAKLERYGHVKVDEDKIYCLIDASKHRAKQ